MRARPRTRSAGGGRLRRSAGILALAAVGLATCAAQAAAPGLTSVSDATDAVVDGTVYAIAHSGSQTFIGGDFTHIGRRSGSGLPVSPSTGVPNYAFPEVAGGTIEAVAPDGSGGWFIGGSFTSVGGVARNNLAHITSTGAVDGFDPSPDGDVDTIVVAPSGSVDAGAVYVGGSFTHIGRPALGRTHAAALCGATGSATCSAAICGGGATCSAGAVLDWKPQPDDVVTALAEAYVPQQQPGGLTTLNEPVVFLGGRFAKLGTQSQAALAAVWGTGAVDAAASPNSISGTMLSWGPTPATSNLRALAVQPKPVSSGDTEAVVAVYDAGDANSSGAGTLEGFQFSIPIAPNGSSRATPDPSSQYSTFDGTAAASCPSPPTADPCAPTVRALALSPDDSTLYAGGDFLKMGGVDTRYLAAVGTVDLINGGLNTPGAFPEADGSVDELAVDPNGVVYAGGAFSHVGPRATPSGLARIVGGAADTNWSGTKPAGGGVDALAATTSAVYVGGDFTTLEAQPVSNLAALNSDGSYNSGWHGATDDGGVRALAVSPDGGTLYVGGNFQHAAGGTSRQHLAAFSTGDGSLLGWDPQADDGVLALATDKSLVYAGGAFTHVAGTTERDHLAALDAGSGALTAWNPGTDRSVRAILPACGAVYVGGAFTQAGGQARSHLAALDPTDGAALAWDPSANTTVRSLAAGPNRIYAGGDFANVQGLPRDGIAAIDSSTGQLAPDWHPRTAPPQVRAVATSPDGSTVYAGGSFLTVDDGTGDVTRSKLAAFDATTGALTAWDPEADTGLLDDVQALLSSGGAVFAGGAFRQVGTAMQQGFASFAGGSAGSSAPPTCAAPARVASSGGSSSDGSSSSSTTHTLKPAVVSSPPPPSPVVTPPPAFAITSFDLAPDRFHVAPAAIRRRHPSRQYGSSFAYDVTAPAHLQIVLSRELFGRSDGATCVAARRAPHGAPCTRFQRYGVIDKDVAAGAGEIRFRGHLAGGWLPAGVYTAKLVATHGTESASQLARFQVLPG